MTNSEGERQRKTKTNKWRNETTKKQKMNMRTIPSIRSAMTNQHRNYYFFFSIFYQELTDIVSVAVHACVRLEVFDGDMNTIEPLTLMHRHRSPSHNVIGLPFSSLTSAASI